MLATASRPVNDGSAAPTADRADLRAPKLLLLISGLGVGGAERLVIQLAQGVKQSGWSVMVVGLEKDQELLDFMPVEGLDIRVLQAKRSLRSIASTTFTMMRLVRQERIDVIHAHLFHSLILALVLRLFNPSLRLVFTSHNYSGFSPLRKVLVRMTRRYRHADILFGTDQHPALNSSRQVVIPNGVDVPDDMPMRGLPAAGQPRRLLYLGRLTPEKNVDQIIDALASLVRSGDPARGDQSQGGRRLPVELSIAGDGPELARLRQKCRELDVESLVHFLGMRSDTTNLLSQCHLLVMASSWEGLPMAVLEAGAMATPVVATPVGCLPALLGDDCGFLTPDGRLTETLAFAFAQPELCNTYGRNLYQRIRADYSMQICLERHKALYCAVLPA